MTTDQKLIKKLEKQFKLEEQQADYYFYQRKDRVQSDIWTNKAEKTKQELEKLQSIEMEMEMGVLTS